jgi:SAM-dependent methyltransferase
MADENSQPRDAWTVYWRAGRSASCFEGSDLEVRLTQLWDEFVDRLPTGARVLDLATGNGTVARSCAARARARNLSLRIDAVDAAAIDPPACVADADDLLRDVQFHANTRLEALPFPDGVFHGIVSQFGFEYADEEPAAAEAVRCMAPGGRMRLVLHARDGAVRRDIGRRLERLKSVLDANGAVSLVLTLARAAEAGDSATLRRESGRLPGAAEQVRRLARRPPPDDAALFYAAETLQLWAQRASYWPADLRRSVEDGWNNAMGVAMRQEQMQQAARSAEQIARIGARFTASGLTVDATRPIRDDRRGVQIAWMIDAHKP